MRCASIVLLGAVELHSLFGQGSVPVRAPQAVGLDPDALARFDADIASGKYGNVDSMLVIRHGK